MPKLTENPRDMVVTFGSIMRKCPVIDIEGDEYKQCLDGSARYWANEKPGNYGKGLIASEEDPTKPVRVGLLGEMAVAKLFGVPVHFGYRKYGDKSDLRIGGGRISVDVKTASRDYGSVLIRCENENGTKIPLSSDFYIAAIVISDDIEGRSARVAIVGSIKRCDVERCEIRQGRGQHFNYDVPFARTRLIEDLLAKHKHWDFSEIGTDLE